DQNRQEAERIPKELENMQLEFTLNTGKGGSTFGQISSKQIAHALSEKGIVVDKRKIMMETPVDSLGTTNVKVDLYKGKIIGTIHVHVSAKGA
uniref:50S ribosomal L9 C-terminal domain-containing protein n=1 Tax=uncultured Allobaculum sp. TaxID=1187017 RepID=UPI00263AA8FC